MRITHPGSSRGNFFDRTPIERTNTFDSGGINPHGITQRWSYAIPATKKFILTNLVAEIARQTAAAPVGFARAYAGLGVNGQLPYLMHIETASNVIDVLAQTSISPGTIMQNGDTLTGFTADTGTGGTCLYRLCFAGIEFDA